MNLNAELHSNAWLMNTKKSAYYNNANTSINYPYVVSFPLPTPVLLNHTLMLSNFAVIQSQKLFASGTVLSSVTVGRSTPASGLSMPTMVGGTSFGSAVEETLTGEMEMIGLGAAPEASGVAAVAVVK